MATNGSSFSNSEASTLSGLPKTPNSPGESVHVHGVAVDWVATGGVVAAGVLDRSAASPRRAVIDPRVRTVEALMHRAMHRKLPLRDLAAGIGLSVSRLGHLFRSELGTTPKRHLKAARLAKAKELLETSTLSVKEVAARVGLDDVARFISDFRRRFGLTPRQYRRAVGITAGVTTETRELTTASKAATFAYE